MAQRAHHHVYVIGLHPGVLQEPKFRRCNPGNACVQKYGLCLLSDLHEGFNPMPDKVAQAREVKVGIELRSAGFGA